MFEGFYKKRKNPIMNIIGWSLLILAAAAVALFGLMPNTSQLGAGGGAAEVNGEIIPIGQINQLVKARTKSNPNTKKQSVAEQRAMRQGVVENLVNRKLVAQKALKLGLVPSGEDILGYISEIPNFQEDGRFSKVLYLKILEQYRGVGQDLEANLKEDIAVNRLNSLFEIALKKTSLEEALEKKLKNTNINLEYLVFDKFNISKSIPVNNDDIANFSNTSGAEEKISTYFNENKNKYFESEKVDVSQILVKIDTKNKNGVNEAKAKIDNINKTLNSQNFGKLASKHTEDLKSKGKQGNLGLLSRGLQPPAFDLEAFTLKEGEVSKVFKTSYGFHIIRVNKKVASRQKNLDEVKTLVISDLIRAEKLSTQVSSLKESMGSPNLALVESFRSEMGLSWAETGKFTIDRETIPKIGSNDEILKLSFGATEAGYILPKIFEIGTSQYIVRVKDLPKIEASAVENKLTGANQFEKYISQMMARQRSMDVLTKWTDTLRERADVKINKL